MIARTAAHVLAVAPSSGDNDSALADQPSVPARAVVPLTALSDFNVPKLPLPPVPR
jgi:hypothetical protein